MRTGSGSFAAVSPRPIPANPLVSVSVDGVRRLAPGQPRRIHRGECRLSPTGDDGNEVHMETRFTLNRRIFRRVPARKRGLIAVLAAAVAASTALAVAAGTGTAASAAPTRADQGSGAATGLGQL